MEKLIRKQMKQDCVESDCLENNALRLGNQLLLLKLVLSLCAEPGSSKKAMFGANRSGRRVTTVCETISSRSRVGAALRSQTLRV